MSVAVAGLFAVVAVGAGLGIGYGIWSGGSAPLANRAGLPSVPRGRTRGTVTRRATSGTPTATTSTSGATASSRISSAAGAPTDIATIRSEVEPGLVDIHTILGYETDEAWGTGMVLTSTGKVLTNNHVIEGSTKISVTDLGNTRTYSAKVLGYTKTDDVALIQLADASGLTTVSLGDSSAVKVGEAVVGIGNAGGVGGTPSAAGGSVTALDHAITASDESSLGTSVEHLTGLIETDCDIQSGDSGGPLVTTSGKVVGMDTASSAAQGFSISGASTVQGFSIPIDTALSIVHQIEGGKSSTSLHVGGTAFLGVFVGSSEPGTANRFFGRTPTTTPSTTTSSTTTSSTPGAIVEGVIPGTPAESAGLATGDVIERIGGSAVTSVTDVTKVVMADRPGQTVKVTWATPAGVSQSAEVTLASGPPD